MSRQLWKKCYKKIICGGIAAAVVAAAGVGMPAVSGQYLNLADSEAVGSVDSERNLADTEKNETNSVSEASEDTSADKKEANNGASRNASDLKNTDSEADRADKTETVYVKADASGKTQEISVEAVLKNPGGTSPMEDVSTLTDIKNTEGDEEYTLAKDGSLTWENHGEDITYKGDADGELPVSVKVTYYLDGKKVSASKIAGKSGEVKIRFDYENETAGEEMVPFAVFSATVLPEDVFSDVTVTNGKLVSMDGQTIVIGYAFPGLEDALGTEEYEPLEDLEIPEYVEITAQAEDFALDFTATIVSNGLFSELDDETFDDAEELTDSMGDLADASDELVDGAAQLLSASQTMSKYLGEYTDGVSAVSDGAQTLADGIRTLNENKDALASGADALAEGLARVNSALAQSDVLSQMQTLGTQMQALRTQMIDYATAVGTGVAGASATLSSVDLSSVETAANEKAQAQVEASSRQVIAEAFKDVEGLTEEQKAEIVESAAQTIASSVDVSGVAAAEQEKIDAAESALASIPQMGADTISGSGSNAAESGSNVAGSGNANASAGSKTQPVVSGSVSNETSLSDLESASAQITTLLQGIQQLTDASAQLSSGIAAYTDGVSQVSTGADTLASGAAQLKTAGASLSEGGSALTDGILALKEGLATFDEEGIEKLTELAGDDLQEIIDRLKTLKNADAEYDNYSGLKEGQSGSVRFIIETEEIE